MKKLLLLLSFLLPAAISMAQPLPTTEWTHLLVDSTREMMHPMGGPDWLRSFGIDAGDINRDGYLDIVAGKYFYLNPGGDMSGEWKRSPFGFSFDGYLFVDVDGDELADIIAEDLPNVVWLEALDTEGSAWCAQKIGEVPRTGHKNGQGAAAADLNGDGKPEILLAAEGGIHMAEIPVNPHSDWGFRLIAASHSDEGIGIGDVDGDGDNDLTFGDSREAGEKAELLYWAENPGHTGSLWKKHLVSDQVEVVDRVEVADLNGDGHPDIAVSEERYPGKKPNANLRVFLSPADPETGSWEHRLVVTQWSMNNLDAADMDNDGDIDLITNEHMGNVHKTEIYLNDGSAHFRAQLVGNGAEMHLGARCYDLDGDGDKDIIGVGWNDYSRLHLFRNEALRAPVTAEKCMYENREHYLVRTEELVYYYDIHGGGFSRIIDREGRDWVSFRMEPWGSYPAAAASSFRGLPNLVFRQEDDGAGHPGHDKCTSAFVDGKLYSKSLSGKWKWCWEFGKDHARLSILENDPGRKYWFLYEGTPGGNFDPEAIYFGTDRGGPYEAEYDHFKGSILRDNFRWIYAGHRDAAGSFYMIQEKADRLSDMVSFLGNSEKGLQSEDGMTVFAFGRGEKAEALLNEKHSFIIGIYPDQIHSGKAHRKFAVYLETKFPDSLKSIVR